MLHSLLRAQSAGTIVFSSFILLIITAACTGNSSSISPTPTTVIDPTAPPSTATIEPDADSVESSVWLAEMWGHIEVSAASSAAGNTSDAVLHSSHPVAEYWTLVSGRLEEGGQDKAVRSALDAYQAVLTDGGDLNSAVVEVRVALMNAIAVVSGSQFDSPEFRALMIRELLETAEREYAEAFDSGAVTNLPEYQDAWGFLNVSKQLYPPVGLDAEARDSEGALEIEDKFEALDAVFVELRPSRSLGDVADVEESVEEIRAELAKIFELAADATGSPEVIVLEIKELMEQAVDGLEKSEYDQAYELAANAYLEGFEQIEGDIISVGRRDLVEQLELQFKEFRDSVRDHASLATVNNLRSEIEAGLGEVLEALEK